MNHTAIKRMNDMCIVYRVPVRIIKTEHFSILCYEQKFNVVFYVMCADTICDAIFITKHNRCDITYKVFLSMELAEEQKTCNVNHIAEVLEYGLINSPPSKIPPGPIEFM